MATSAPQLPAPKFSICLPTLNARAFLEERLESILTQTLTNWELIVCDSHSTDGTWEYLSQWAHDPRVHLHRVPKEGLYAGWNECLKRATGKYVYIATADDTCTPELLERLAEPMDGNENIAVAYCGYRAIDGHGQELTLRRTTFQKFIEPWMDARHDVDGRALFLVTCAFDHNWGSVTGFAFRRALLERTGLFRTDMGMNADCEWALRTLLASPLVAFIPGRLATWRLHETQASRDWGMEDARLCRDSMRDLLNDAQAGLPEAWKTVPGWREQLMLKREWSYEELSSLFRFVARSNPRRFLAQCWRVGKQDPRLFFHQLFRLFAFPPMPTSSWEAHAQHLLATFPCDWPPASISPADRPSF